MPKIASLDALNHMKLAILHYHLNRGGVTQVVANQLRSLAVTGESPIEEIKILYGGRQKGWPNDLQSQLGATSLSLVEVPALEYDNGRESSNLAVELAETLERELLLPDNCLLHIHNHALGKNVQLPQVVADLGRSGYRQLLQIHDFAEDFRPHNYRRLVESIAPQAPESMAASLYPQASHIHYATLNRRDHTLLSRAGVRQTRLHYLPNPVSAFPSLPSRRESRDKLARRFGIDPDRRFVLYPVRAIRRKNLGELLLWSAATPSTMYGVTLNPLNEAEIPSFQAWCGTIGRLRLPVVTGLGEANGLSFLENVSAADVFITTSVAEGFGMVFLESWLAGCPLIGRDLPEISTDFYAAGMRFDGMTARIDIPLDWICDLEDLRTVYWKSANQVLRTFGRPELSLQQAADAFSRLLVNDCIDFACLDLARQAEIIEQVQERSERRKQLLATNPVMREAAKLDRVQCQEVIASNAERARAYSFEVSGRRLLEVYDQLCQAPRSEVTTLPSALSILESLLDPTRLQLIRLQT